MKKEYYYATTEVIALLEKRIEAEQSWMKQGEGYALASARITNVLRELIGEICDLGNQAEAIFEGNERPKVIAEQQELQLQGQN